MANVDTTRVIAAVVGLAGFSVALVAGLAADNPFDVCVLRGIFALVACTVVGLPIGWVLRKATAASTPMSIPPLAPAGGATQTGT